jgi:hypothetical protein
MHRRLGLVVFVLALTTALPLAAQQGAGQASSFMTGVHPADVKSVPVDVNAALKTFNSNSKFIRPTTPTGQVNFAPFKPHTLSYLMPKLSLANPLNWFSKSKTPPARSNRNSRRKTK